MSWGTSDIKSNSTAFNQLYTKRYIQNIVGCCHGEAIKILHCCREEKIRRKKFLRIKSKYRRMRVISPSSRKFESIMYKQHMPEKNKRVSEKHLYKRE